MSSTALETAIMSIPIDKHDLYTVVEKASLEKQIANHNETFAAMAELRQQHAEELKKRDAELKAKDEEIKARQSLIDAMGGHEIVKELKRQAELAAKLKQREELEKQIAQLQPKGDSNGSGTES